MKDGKRTFTVVKVETNSKSKKKHNLGGVYTSSTTPAVAARKAGSMICRNSSTKGQCTLYITIRETTQASNKKEYTYKYKRIKLDEPIENTERPGVVYQYTSTIYAVK